MTTQHAPGPWTPEDTNIPVYPRFVCAHGDVVARVYSIQPPHNTAEALANARLIAAAPELLAVLEELVHAVDQMEAPYWPAFVDEMLGKARDTITKARGL